MSFSYEVEPDATDNKERFSNRVDNYVKYRPGYPQEALDYLFGEVGLSSGCKVLDMGAGTGIFTRLLLDRGAEVTAVEPNQAMREALELALGDRSGFHAVAGSAEAVELPDGSADFIVCAQSFHWFDREAAQREFRRLLKPGGRVVLVWNSRLTEGTPFLEQYEQLLHTYGTDFVAVNHRNISGGALASFFKEGSLRESRFTNRQDFDYEGLAGRLLSSSYAPEHGHPQHEPMLAALRELFDRTSQNGTVAFLYETEVFWGEV